MTFIVCLDCENGIMFNNRRLSRDKSVINDLFSNIKIESIHIKDFSKILFDEFENRIIVTEDFSSLNENDVCFIENPEDFIEAECENLIIYYWNRLYPADTYLNLDFKIFTLTNETDFKGHSHEKITRKIFKRG